MHVGHPAAVLYGNGGDSGGGIGSMGGNGLQVRLYAGSAAAVGSGDAEYARIGFHIRMLLGLSVAKIVISFRIVMGTIRKSFYIVK